MEGLQMGEREDEKNQTCNELPYHERRRKMDKDEHGLETRTPEVRRVGCVGNAGTYAC